MSDEHEHEQEQLKTFTLIKRKPKDFIAAHANASPASLLDELREARDAESLAKGQAGMLKTMLFARVEPQILGTANDHGRTITSDNNSATCKWVVQNRFNTEAFATDHPDLYKKYCGPTEFIQLKYEKE